MIFGRKISIYQRFIDRVFRIFVKREVIVKMDFVSIVTCRQTFRLSKIDVTAPSRNEIYIYVYVYHRSMVSQ